MISAVSLSFKNKAMFLAFIHSNNEIIEITTVRDIKNNVNYPDVDAKSDSVTYKTYKYYGYLRTDLRYLYSSEKECDYPYLLIYRQLAESIDILRKKYPSELKSNLSKLTMTFYVSTDFPALNVIKTNLLMYNLLEYNYDKEKGKKSNFKVFEFTNYDFGLYTELKSSTKSKTLKIVLRLKKNAEFKKFGIIEETDLMDKKKLSKLFELFLKRFDQLTIIDNINDIVDLSSKDEAYLKQYINPVFWSQLSLNKNRKLKFKHKKRFEELQIKYSLTKLKAQIRKGLITSFNNFINN